MPVDLTNYVESLKREVTPPGSDLFDDVTEPTWVGYLVDAFWEARLDGFLDKWEADPSGEVTSVGGGESIPRDQIALVILYAGIKVLRNRIMNLNTSFRAEAGPVSFETQNSATMLSEMLRQLERLKDRLLEQADDPTGVAMFDMYTTRLQWPETYHGTGW